MRFALKAAAHAAPFLMTVGLVSCTQSTGVGGGPTMTVPPTGAVQMAAGLFHTCALLANGTVTCWGDNVYGQLGTATNSGTGNANPTPTVVAGLTGVTQIAAGGDHTSAVRTTGTVTCWGFNQFGQLGNATNNGTTNANPTPTAVAGLTGVTRLTAGYDHTCALRTDHTVSCWGENLSGQLGNATNNVTINPNPTPTAVAGLTGVTQISAGRFDTCALLAAHTVSCWGENFAGQLGNTTNNGTSHPNPTPTAVAGLTGVIQITMGAFHTCALLAGHTLSCWGYNDHGQLGTATNSSTGNPNPTPIAVAGLTGVIQIVAGGEHTCVLLAGHTLSCWGLNQSGELGNATNNGNQNANPTPAAVAGLTGVIQVTAGGDHMCGLLVGHTLSCWGLNQFGELGNATNNGSQNANPTPSAIAGIP